MCKTEIVALDFAKFFQKDLTNGGSNGIISWYQNEMWISLVERYVRDTITVLGVDFSESAESP